MAKWSLLAGLPRVLVLVALVASMPSLALAETAKIRVSGTGSGLGLIKVLAAAYMKNAPGVTIDVLPSLGSSGGIKALLQGALELSVSSRPVKDEERLKGVEAVEIAHTPFVFISHQQVPAKGLTVTEVESLYGGRTTAWENGARVRLVLRPPDDTDSKLLRGFSPGVAAALDSAQTREGMIMAPTDQDSLLSTGTVTGALGTASLVQLLTEKHQVKMLALNGVVPSVKAMTAGKYPMRKTLYLVARKNDPAVARFVAFVKSPAAAALLGKYGCAPVQGSAGH